MRFFQLPITGYVAYTQIIYLFIIFYIGVQYCTSQSGSPRWGLCLQPVLVHIGYDHAYPLAFHSQDQPTRFITGVLVRFRSFALSSSSCLSFDTPFTKLTGTLQRDALLSKGIGTKEFQLIFEYLNSDRVENSFVKGFVKS